MTQTVADRVRKVVAEKFRLDASKDAAKLVDSASFTDDLKADSLDIAEIVMLFEEEFACEIQNQDAEKIKTIKDAIDFIEQHAKK